MAAWREALLGRVLPDDLARLVVRHSLEDGAATRVQAAARGLLVRSPRPPPDGCGFACVDEPCERVGMYAYEGEALGADLEAWAAGRWGAGRYEIQVRLWHADGVSSMLDGEAMVVRSKGVRGVRWIEPLPDSSVYERAFAPVHGRPCAHRVLVERRPYTR